MKRGLQRMSRVRLFSYNVRPHQSAFCRLHMGQHFLLDASIANVPWIPHSSTDFSKPRYMRLPTTFSIRSISPTTLPFLAALLPLDCVFRRFAAVAVFGPSCP